MDDYGVAKQNQPWEHKPTYIQMANTANIIAKQKPKTRAEYDDQWIVRAEDGRRFHTWEAAIAYATKKQLKLYLRGHGRRAVWRPSMA